MNLPYLRKLIEDYKKRAIELSWIGQKHPDDHDSIEWDYKYARNKLYNYLKKEVKE